ncbi:MAG: hypothetical protein RLZZ196_910 [Bacteroidota bacterium]|jgi:hypothetical protein
MRAREFDKNLVKKTEGFDLSKGNGSAPIQGDDVVTSPIGSISKPQRNKNVKKLYKTS